MQGLRASTVERNDLAVAIRTLGDELATHASATSRRHSVAVEGETRDLHPIVRDEIYKIAAEALRMPSGTRMPDGSRSRSATTRAIPIARA